MSQQWPKLELHCGSVTTGLGIAYMLLEVVPAIKVEYTIVGQQIYWLLLIVLSLYFELKSVFPRPYLYSCFTQNLSIQNAQLLKVNQQLRQTLHVQTMTEQRLAASNQILQRLAITDGLTQIYNRHFFDQQLHAAWQRLGQDGCPISMILFDVDYFKQYNDYYGHQAGDVCLQQIAQVARTSLPRPVDFVARYGGEEFAVVLPNMSQQSAIATAKRIQQALQKLAIPHRRSNVGAIVSISLGIASMVPTIDTSCKTLVTLADQALYEAKRQGRDRHIANSTVLI
ncbi:diguanylate cyclase [Leptothoe spongobia]|uniref:GGDEF domain-containing protein n=1 Tax=Leptothoe spongobia TAU-MAC 1115 TaxID=1967444 RepID=A0A947DAW7_9CYAN|nr:diguanylate cyclase [Leptothoe spongobia]MBT9314011.1 GGDEF domain-containing protein [Leptothoe spongobia TAU-MAC 1115]